MASVAGTAGAGEPAGTKAAASSVPPTSAADSDCNGNGVRAAAAGISASAPNTSGSATLPLSGGSRTARVGSNNGYYFESGGSAGENKPTVEIRTKSVEQTLVPLVTQITTLVNARERLIKSERTLHALQCVGVAVTVAVDRFVSVGKAIAADNIEIQREMRDACDDAQHAGARIQQLTDLRLGEGNNAAEKAAMVRAARHLLSAITRVLLLADKVVIKQLIAAKNKVLHSLSLIESCTKFGEFVKVFSEFGNDMVELAHLSGDRQQDLKSEKCRTQIIAARTVLEKSTMMLLTAAKTSLRHPECPSAHSNTAGVIATMRRALDTIHTVVSNGGYASGNASPSGAVGGGGGVNCDSGINLSQHQPTAIRAIKDFSNLVEMTRVTLVSTQTEQKLLTSVETLIDTTQDFTDSAYTSHDRRQRILMSCERLRHELTVLLRVGANARDGSPVSSALSHQLETEILKTQEASKALHSQLIETAMEHASETFKLNEDQRLLSELKTAALAGNKSKVDEVSVKFQEHSDQLQEVCKLLRHIATTETLVVWCDHTETNTKLQCPEVIHSSQTLASYPTSKIAAENSEVFANAWQTQINDLSVLVKDINDACSGRNNRQVYLSLPRPGKHGSTARAVKPSQLSVDEQARIAKAGLEMKLITSEMDAETDRWSNTERRDSEILQRAKNMSSMAFSMYLFTRGEGSLQTTQDLFTQAGYFAEEGTKLYHTLKQFAMRIPPDIGHKSDLAVYIDVLPYYCQQLNMTVKSPTIGKAATFNKVDKVIQETKNLMNAVSKVISASFLYPMLSSAPIDTRLKLQ